jgi:hypothetical protein
MIPETVNTPAHQDDMLIRLSVELLEGFRRLRLILRIPTLNNFKINKKKNCVCVHCLGIVPFIMRKLYRASGHVAARDGSRSDYSLVRESDLGGGGAGAGGGGRVRVWGLSRGRPPADIEEVGVGAVVRLAVSGSEARPEGEGCW